MRRLGCLIAALALGACGESETDPPAASSRALAVTARLECCRAEGDPGITLRVSLSVPWGFVPKGSKDCPRLPESARVLVNGVVADVVDPGGPLLGGLDGATFLICKQEAFAEAGPLTRAEAANVRVSLEEAGRVAEAELGDLVTEPKLRAAAPAQVKLGAEIVLPADHLPFGVRLSYAELAQVDGGTTRRRGGPVLRLNDDLHVWLAGRPGPATLTLSGETYPNRESAARCDGFTTCERTRTVLLGPLTVELTP